MGYKLFMAGVWGKAGELDGNIHDNRLSLKQAALGTFFAVLGGSIISLSVIKGFDFEHSSKIENSPETPKPELPLLEGTDE